MTPARWIVRAYQHRVLVREVVAVDVRGIPTDAGGWNLIAVVSPRIRWRFPMGRAGMSFTIGAAA